MTKDREHVDVVQFSSADCRLRCTLALSHSHGQLLFAFGLKAPGGSQEGSMDKKTLNELEEFAKRKGFLLTVLEEGEGNANVEGGKYVLEATEDGDAETASFKTETALRRFLGAPRSSSNTTPETPRP
jgi:hypothetical protein